MTDSTPRLPSMALDDEKTVFTLCFFAMNELIGLHGALAEGQFPASEAGPRRQMLAQSLSDILEGRHEGFTAAAGLTGEPLRAFLRRELGEDLAALPEQERETSSSEDGIVPFAVSRMLAEMDAVLGSVRGGRDAEPSRAGRECVRRWSRRFLARPAHEE